MRKRRKDEEKENRKLDQRFRSQQKETRTRLGKGLSQRDSKTEFLRKKETERKRERKK